MKELWKACRKGLPMVKQVFWRWIQIPIALAGLAVIIGAPFGISLIDNTLFKVLVWVFLLMVILIIAICVGLTPYWGQKEIMREEIEKKDTIIKEKDIWIGAQDKFINDWRTRANNAEQELNKHK